jgi:uncharacterized protein (TIRG00374 family)
MAAEEMNSQQEVVPSNRGSWMLAFQLIGTLVILLIVFLALSSPGEVLAVLRRADYRWVLGAVGIVFISESLSSLKWWLLLRQAGSTCGLVSIMRAYWIGMFYGTYLPGSVSGDAARVLLTRRESGTTAAAAAVFMQRNTGLAAMLVLAVGFSALAPVSIGIFSGKLAWLDHPLPWFLVAALGYGAINLVLVSPWVAEWVHRVLAWVLPQKAVRVVDRVLNSAIRGRALLRQFWGSASLPLLLSFVSQILDGTVLVLLAWSLGLSVSFESIYQAMAAISLASMLPLTINGIGIREVGFGLMMQSGLVSGQAVALGLLTTGLYLLCALPGGALHGGALLRKSAEPAHGT